MRETTNCVQFYVGGKGAMQNGSVDTAPNSFVLHLDEVDVSGICQSQLHCSLKPSSSVCQNLYDCDELVIKAKSFFRDVDVLSMGQTRFSIRQLR